MDYGLENRLDRIIDLLETIADRLDNVTATIENVQGNSNNQYVVTLADIDETISNTSKQLQEMLLSSSHETIESINSLHSVSKDICGNLSFLVDQDVNLSSLYNLAIGKQKGAAEEVEDKLSF